MMPQGRTLFWSDPRSTTPAPPLPPGQWDTDKIDGNIPWNTTKIFDEEYFDFYFYEVDKDGIAKRIKANVALLASPPTSLKLRLMKRVSMYVSQQRPVVKSMIHVWEALLLLFWMFFTHTQKGEKLNCKNLCSRFSAISRVLLTPKISRNAHHDA